MKKIVILMLSVIVLIACESKESANDSQDIKTNISNVLLKGNSPYLDWYFSNMESFVSLTYNTYPLDSKHQLNKSRGDEDNTITLKNGIKIRLHDEYSIHNDGNNTTLKLIRSGRILKDASNGPRRQKAEEGEGVGPFTYTYTLHSTLPLELSSPEISSCDPIPMCYYDNFKINWNQDPMNENGVVIISEWNGCTIYDSPEDTTISHIDIVPDTGEAILNTDLFEDMPDESLVNLWLIRGNMITIEGDGEISLSDALLESPEVFSELVATHPELLIQMQPFRLGSGAVTDFSFFLIRDLHN